MAHATKKDTKLRIQELFLRVSLILTSQANHAHFCSTKVVQHAKQCLLPTGFLSPLDPQGTFGFYSCTVVSISSHTCQPAALTIPSIPWGKSRTIPLWRTHLVWPELMNWSIMHCAVLWKSPNWASQHTKALGLAIAKPSSKPENQTSRRIRKETGWELLISHWKRK